MPHKPPDLSPDVANRIDAGEVMLRAEQAVAAACDFFGISNEWRVRVLARTPPEGAADITHDPSYLWADIRLDIAYYRQYPQELWSDMGHEVAHLVTSELGHLWMRLPQDHPTVQALQPYRKDAVERATVRLERLWLRCNPDPHAGSPPT